MPALHTTLQHKESTLKVCKKGVLLCTCLPFVFVLIITAEEGLSNRLVSLHRYNRRGPRTNLTIWEECCSFCLPTVCSVPLLTAGEARTQICASQEKCFPASSSASLSRLLFVDLSVGSAASACTNPLPSRIESCPHPWITDLSLQSQCPENHISSSGMLDLCHDLYIHHTLHPSEFSFHQQFLCA